MHVLLIPFTADAPLGETPRPHCLPFPLTSARSLNIGLIFDFLNIRRGSKKRLPVPSRFIAVALRYANAPSQALGALRRSV